jgi:hypothetical protein
VHDPYQLQVLLQEKLLTDPESVETFLFGLRLHLLDTHKVKRMLMPVVCSSTPLVSCFYTSGGP